MLDIEATLPESALMVVERSSWLVMVTSVMPMPQVVRDLAFLSIVAICSRADSPSFLIFCSKTALVLPTMKVMKKIEIVIINITVIDTTTKSSIKVKPATDFLGI